MPHDISLIATLAAAFGLAMVLGYVAIRLRMPPLVGYLLAGVVVSPSTPGYVADVGLAMQLAEVGVMLLMFGVGLHFSFKDLMAVKWVALPGAVVQIAVATLMGAGMARWWGWSWSAAWVLGLCLSVASTVVLLRALEARGLLRSLHGQIAVGWLVVEDLVMVVVLVLLPVLAGTWGEGQGDGAATASGTESATWALVQTLAKVGAFMAFMLVVGKRVLPRMLWAVARTGSQELFRLTVIAVALGVAFGAAQLFDVSFALGAFFAGMMMRESELSHRAADESLPLRDAFAVLFFVSVGMLFDPRVLIEQPLQLLGVVLIILLGKTLAAVALVLLMRYPLQTALTVGASLAQIGEFSFILAGLAVGLNIFPPEGQSLVLAGALVSIAANSALFGLIEPVQQWLVRRSGFVRRLQAREDPLSALPSHTTAQHLSGQVVLVGLGATGERIAQALQAQGVPFVVAEQNRERAQHLREQGVSVVWGDATTPEVLVQAHVLRAAMLVVSVADAVAARQMVATARQLNPGIGVLLRAPNSQEAELLQHDTQAQVLVADHTLAQAMASQVLQALRPGAPGSVSQPG